MRYLNLTGDRPLVKSEARKLIRWWHGYNGWTVSTNKCGKYYHVLAGKEE